MYRYNNIIHYHSLCLVPKGAVSECGRKVEKNTMYLLSIITINHYYHVLFYILFYIL